MNLLLVTGQDALTLGSVCHRQPEVLRNDIWQTASGLPEATRLLQVNPALVRLKADARVLIEDVTKRALTPDADLNAAIASARAGTLSEGQARALDIIEREINP